MYCIKKFADCWAVFNLDEDLSRRLTEDEVLKVREEIPSLNDSEVVSYYTNNIYSLDDLP